MRCFLIKLFCILVGAILGDQSRGMVRLPFVKVKGESFLVFHCLTQTVVGIKLNHVS